MIAVCPAGGAVRRDHGCVQPSGPQAVIAGTGFRAGARTLGRMRQSPAALVQQFHHAFGLDARRAPAEIPPELAAHRQDLLAEEFAEVSEVAVTGPLDHLAQELADVVYIAYGTALVHGIDLDEVLAEVHRANMSKLGPDHTPVRRPDGKVLKGPHYRAPDIASVLRAQGWTPPEQ
ncbi:secreted protein [Streptomyces clavuligerus]|uniref:Secreted protein n=2 Tax=Streptomyces clavuligerus TaxID=1901 RepID=E2PUL5_STRCL|nr:secreted protein [Streptomyces clavuligerus]